jgi:hypothetical protein
VRRVQEQQTILGKIRQLAKTGFFHRIDTHLSWRQQLIGALNTTRDTTAKKKQSALDELRNSEPRVREDSITRIKNDMDYSAYARKKSINMLAKILPAESMRELKAFTTFAATDKTRERLKDSLMKAVKQTKYKCSEGPPLAEEEAWTQRNVYNQLHVAGQPVAKGTIDLTAVEDEASAVARCQRPTARGGGQKEGKEDGADEESPKKGRKKKRKKRQ